MRTANITIPALAKMSKQAILKRYCSIWLKRRFIEFYSVNVFSLL